MSELILRDSGLLVDVADEFPEVDEKFYQIVNSGQTFFRRLRDRQIWFYCPNTNTFYQNNRKRHGLFNAIDSRFSQDRIRWDEIQEVLDDLGANDLLKNLNIVLFRRKLIIARRKGLISDDERQTILSIVDHLEATG